MVPYPEAKGNYFIHPNYNSPPGYAKKALPLSVQRTAPRYHVPDTFCLVTALCLHQIHAVARHSLGICIPLSLSIPSYISLCLCPGLIRDCTNYCGGFSWYYKGQNTSVPPPDSGKTFVSAAQESVPPSIHPPNNPG